MKLIGQFKQLVTLRNLPLRGKLSDNQLEIIENGGILIENGLIKKVAEFEVLKEELENNKISFDLELIENEQICLPSFVDSHAYFIWWKPFQRFCSAKCRKNLS